MNRIGVVGEASVRTYSFRAAERKVYDTLEKGQFTEKETALETERYENILEAHKGGSAPETKSDILVAGGEVGAQSQIQEGVEDTAAGQQQRQDGSWEMPAKISQLEPEAADDTNATIPGTSTLKAAEEVLLPGEVEVACAALNIKLSNTNTERDVQDEVQDSDDRDAEDRHKFPDFEDNPVDNDKDVEPLGFEKEFGEVESDKYSREYQDLQAYLDLDRLPINRNIHILGLAAAGKYIAHSIASLPFAPPVTLLMHRPLMMQLWHDEGAAIHVIKDGELKTQSNFHIESSADFGGPDAPERFPGFGPNLEHTAEPPRYPIDALIVTTEPYRTISALTAIKHRLGKSSTIFLINDGLGLAERINETVFPDPSDRPTYILGNLSHTLQSTERQYTLIEKTAGRLECSKFPQVLVSRQDWKSPIITRKDFSWTPHASHLVGTLARAPELSTLTLGHKSFIEKRLQDLAAGAVIGPLSVVFDCTNDLLLYNYNASQIMTPLLHEISRVVRSLPELQSLPGLHKAFSVKKLNGIIMAKIMRTGKNTSTMLQRVRAGHRTDIDYFNGYIERRAKELRIPTPRNQMMLQMVKGKGAVRSREINNYIPFDESF
ncbi:hypothetical protein VTL71DRAFT_3070 [Oculimacula yallundae]|uniref:2-dehydropantoate 2-reductase n=1 Tax=Oculimacula yallundae TaxID=86028 RepID=A0ABR4C630_9HELO